MVRTEISKYFAEGFLQTITKGLISQKVLFLHNINIKFRQFNKIVLLPFNSESERNLSN
jgi:hypothetical protein